MSITKQPEIKLDSPTLILPFIIQGRNKELIDDIDFKFYKNLKNSLKKQDLYYKMHYSLNKLRKIARDIMKNNRVDTSIFQRSNIKLLFTAELIIGEELYSSYSEGTSINPDYSAEREGDPRWLESATQWRNRAMNDLSLSMKLHVYIYNIEKDTTVYSEVVKKEEILEDYKNKNLKQSRIYFYNYLIQQMADYYKNEFQVHEKTVRRKYLR